MSIEVRINVGDVHLSNPYFGNITDTAEGIAAELVQANLVDPKDVDVVASNLHKLVNTPITSSSGAKDAASSSGVTPSGALRSLVFALVSIVLIILMFN